MRKTFIGLKIGWPPTNTWNTICYRLGYFFKFYLHEYFQVCIQPQSFLEFLNISRINKCSTCTNISLKAQTQPGGSSYYLLYFSMCLKFFLIKRIFKTFKHKFQKSPKGQPWAKLGGNLRTLKIRSKYLIFELHL